ncbi:hypothetical protein LTS18_005094 [Coniosporium uncinatum]|uniref:Uncharacterized protein n=1 Tax=Coniosporium uncinatum TaxID=93489 RepID=A0ACC3DB87_9PEZI|nr:hypothetical protein LTS18_005094 [Coniosporium uncinatum]
MSIFSKTKGAKKAAEEHKKAQQHPQPAEKPKEAYKHVPTHAAQDAATSNVGTPTDMKERIRLSYRRQSTTNSSTELVEEEDDEGEGSAGSSENLPVDSSKTSTTSHSSKSSRSITLETKRSVLPLRQPQSLTKAKASEPPRAQTVAAEPAVSPVPENAILQHAPAPATASDQAHHAITSDWLVPYSGPSSYSGKEMPIKSKADVSPEVHPTVADDGTFDVQSIISAFPDVPNLSINQPVGGEGSIDALSNTSPVNSNQQSSRESATDFAPRTSIDSHQRGPSAASIDYFSSRGSPKQTQPAPKPTQAVQEEGEWVPNYRAAFHGRSQPASAALGPFTPATNDPPTHTIIQPEDEAELTRIAEEEAALAEAEAEVQRKREELRRKREAQGQSRQSSYGTTPNDPAMANKITNVLPYNDYSRASRASKASKANAEAASPLSSASNSPNRASMGQLDSARRSRSAVSWGAPMAIHEDMSLERIAPTLPQGSSLSPFNGQTAPRFRESFDGPIQPPPHPHTPTGSYGSLASSARSYDSVPNGPPPQFIDRSVGQFPRKPSNGNQYSYPAHPNFPRQMETGPQIPQRARSDAVQSKAEKKLSKKRSRSSFGWFGKRNSAQVTAH